MKKTAAVLSLALVLGSRPAFAAGAPVPLPTQVQNAYDFYQRNKAWLQSLTDLKGISDKIFSQENLKNMAGIAVQRLTDQGINVAGIDPNGFLTDLQAQIDTIKNKISAGQAYIASAAFLKPGTNDVDTAIAFNPTLQIIKLEAARQQVQADQQTKTQLQNSGDSTKTVQDTLETANQMQRSAGKIASQSLSLGNSLNNADSTRAGVEVVGQIILEDMNNRAMSDAALASQFAQLAKSMDITNQTMGAVVSDIIQKKKGEALARQNLIAQKEAQAETNAEETRKSIQGTGDSIVRMVAPTTTQERTADLLWGK